MPFYEGYAFVKAEEGDEDIVKVIDTKGDGQNEHH